MERERHPNPARYQAREMLQLDGSGLIAQEMKQGKEGKEFVKSASPAEMRWQ